MLYRTTSRLALGRPRSTQYMTAVRGLRCGWVVACGVAPGRIGEWIVETRRLAIHTRQYARLGLMGQYRFAVLGFGHGRGWIDIRQEQARNDAQMKSPAEAGRAVHSIACRSTPFSPPRSLGPWTFPCHRDMRAIYKTRALVSRSSRGMRRPENPCPACNHFAIH